MDDLTLRVAELERLLLEQAKAGKSHEAYATDARSKLREIAEHPRCPPTVRERVAAIIAEEGELRAQLDEARFLEAPHGLGFTNLR